MSSLIVFLDIDGVLNSTAYWQANKPLPMNKAGAIDPEAVARLNRILDETGAKVVLSSSWRGRSHADEFLRVEAMLVERGYTGTIVDQTPLWWCDRWIEIEGWLTKFLGEWDRFVVLDDDPDAWSSRGAFNDRGLFASTNYLEGLIDPHIPLIVDWVMQS